MNDYIISQERISWQASLREFHQLERDDEELNKEVEALEKEYTIIQKHGEDVLKKLSDALKAQLPIDQAHEELSYKVERAKIAMEKEEANRKETEKLLRQEMQYKDNLVATSREMMEQRLKNEIEKEEKKWEWERLRMKIENETNTERLIIAESEIEEMMKSQDEQEHMKKDHFDQMVRLKAEIKVDEEKWRVESERILCQQIELRNESRSREKLWAESRKAKTDKFKKEMALKEMNWKNLRHKLLKKNRTLALKSSFTEHWIKDLEEQIRTVGAEILEMKKSLTVNIHVLEEKCLAILDDQATDPEQVKQIFRTNLNLADMMPSANSKNSVWKVVDGWK